MGDIEPKASNRIELRASRSVTAASAAWMTVTHEGHVISFPVRTQLGTAITVSVGDGTHSLHNGKLFIQDGGRAPHSAKASKERTYGLVHYLGLTEADAEAQEQFHVKLYAPTERYHVIWDLSARGHLPQLITLKVKGLQTDSRWDVSDVGNMLLVEDFSFSFPIDTPGLHNPA
jgi:hypothetical protein